MSTATVDLARMGPLGADDFVACANGTRLQVCRATVQSAQGAQRITLILLPSDDNSSPMFASYREVAAEEPPGTIPALVTHGLEEQSTVTIDPVHEPYACPIAAAVAVMRASWGWDESPSMRINVNGRRIAVVPHYSGAAWQTTITADAV